MSKLSNYKLLIIYIFTLLFACFSETNAQNRHIIRNQGFYYGFEGFYGMNHKLISNYIVDTEAFSPSSYGLKATANWFINYHLSMGASLGLLNYESPGMFTFPVLANSQIYWSKGSNTPFAYAEGGYGFRLNHEHQDKGLLYEFGLGYRYRVKWENFFVFKVGYHEFKNEEWLWERKRGTTIDPTDPYQWYSLKRQTITFTIGFYYSTRY